VRVTMYNNLNTALYVFA